MVGHESASGLPSIKSGHNMDSQGRQYTRWTSETNPKLARFRPLPNHEPRSARPCACRCAPLLAEACMCGLPRSHRRWLKQTASAIREHFAAGDRTLGRLHLVIARWGRGVGGRRVAWASARLRRCSSTLQALRCVLHPRDRVARGAPRCELHRSVVSPELRTRAGWSRGRCLLRRSRSVDSLRPRLANAVPLHVLHPTVSVCEREYCRMTHDRHGRQ